MMAPKKTYHRDCKSFDAFLPLDREEILDIIGNMNPTMSIMDPCNTRFLLKFKEIIVDTITTITNQSLTTGEFLDDWKVAAVRPLIKDANIGTEFKNYRPISNLSFLSKDNRKRQPKYNCKSTLMNIHYYPTTKVHIDSITRLKQQC